MVQFKFNKDGNAYVNDLAKHPNSFIQIGGDIAWKSYGGLFAWYDPINETVAVYNISELTDAELEGKYSVGTQTFYLDEFEFDLKQLGLDKVQDLKLSQILREQVGMSGCDDEVYCEKCKSKDRTIFPNAEMVESQIFEKEIVHGFGEIEPDQLIMQYSDSFKRARFKNPSEINKYILENIVYLKLEGTDPITDWFAYSLLITNNRIKINWDKKKEVNALGESLNSTQNCYYDLKEKKIVAMPKGHSEESLLNSQKGKTHVKTSIVAKKSSKKISTKKPEPTKVIPKKSSKKITTKKPEPTKVIPKKSSKKISTKKPEPTKVIPKKSSKKITTKKPEPTKVIPKKSSKKAIPKHFKCEYINELDITVPDFKTFKTFKMQFGVLVTNPYIIDGVSIVLGIRKEDLETVPYLLDLETVTVVYLLDPNTFDVTPVDIRLIKTVNNEKPLSEEKMIDFISFDHGLDFEKEAKINYKKIKAFQKELMKCEYIDLMDLKKYPKGYRLEKSSKKTTAKNESTSVKPLTLKEKLLLMKKEKEPKRT
jgi:hypothetical protein